MLTRITIKLTPTTRSIWAVRLAALNELGPEFDAADRPNGHDAAQPEIDVAKVFGSFCAATTDLPTIWARSVPDDKIHVRQSRAEEVAGPARKLPPTPKNPPKTPTIKPTRTSKAGAMRVCEIGKSIYGPDFLRGM